jgi:hypothetical protein
MGLIATMQLPQSSHSIIAQHSTDPEVSYTDKATFHFNRANCCFASTAAVYTKIDVPNEPVI